MNERDEGVLSPKVPRSVWVVAMEDSLGFREFNTSGNGFRKEASGNVDCFYPTAYVKFCMLSYCVYSTGLFCVDLKRSSEYICFLWYLRTML